MAEGGSPVRTSSRGIEFVRTPEERFARLPDFDHRPDFVEVDGLRMAYVDVGPPEAPAVLFLHGEPAWGFLYRRMIPTIVAGGFRCVVPDLIGFGRSDKPIHRDVYTYNGHVAWLHGFLDLIELGDRSRLFAQDWGGLLGLRLVAERPDQFGHVAVGNTALPTGESAGDGFDAWLAYSQSLQFATPGSVGSLFRRAVRARSLTDAEVAGYDAPFPDVASMAGAIAFPALVPVTPAHDAVAENRAAWRTLESRNEPFLTLWCPDDPVLGHLATTFIERIPGAANQPHQSFTPGGHFVQDDCGEDVAAALVEWWTSTE